MLPDLLCLSHLRWGFVFQRPNHLMTRFARERRVFFVEEPIDDPGPARMETSTPAENVTVWTPHLRLGSPTETEVAVAGLLRDALERERVVRPLQWFYTPMALPLVEDVDASAVIYDCMDELSAFRGAPAELLARETQLLRRADLVFTGGESLYEAKRRRHPKAYAFPSSVDVEHFAAAAAGGLPVPADQAGIPNPRVGFFGVIDERLDLELLARLADERPHYSIVMVGPVVKIDRDTLPQRPNIHWLGPKRYEELPAYLSGWDVAIMPFARNEATRYISPTKTLEYMAAMKPIVSTAIADVVKPYGRAGLVRVTDAAGFASAVDYALAESPAARRAAFEETLAKTSWDRTWQQMANLVARAEGARQAAAMRKGA